MGELLSLASGVAFGSSNVLTRRGVFQARESFSPLPISIAIGILVMLVAVLIEGSAGRLAFLSLTGILALAGAGILHFVVGRAFNYTSLSLLGANRAQPLIGANILIAIAFGMIFLHETISLNQALGAIAVFSGVVIIGSSAEGFARGAKLTGPAKLKGIATALLAGLCYGTSPLLIKIGLREINSGVAGSLVSHLAAGLVIAAFLVSQRNRARLRKLDRQALGSMVAGGTSLALGQIMRYLALGLAPITVAIPLASTDNISVPIVSYLVNRKIEVFSPRVLGGTFMVVAGIYVILLLK